ncbi:MAG: TatD family hydrolase [SAR324 cluster bacterium]|nr:TatD family hydrolase [SAR324 cluster bacterium]MCZ6534190.1 TatD family hydrolase [SAR324 cluster bacterium]MCZ6646238.1 TatD family hydrolase [SAR324 cluster bacterium]
MIDCHTHLTSSDFDADRDAVLARAEAAGVRRIAVVGQDARENRAVRELTRGDARLLCFMGLHPDRFADRGPLPEEEEVARTVAEIREAVPDLAGIGEVGLDYWLCRDEARREAQRAAFTTLIDLAMECTLPLNVHSRSAGHYTIDLLLALGAGQVLMHAFDGKASHALRGAEAGFVFSIPPSIVRSQQKQKLVRALPMEALGLETDSPVLGPTREERNEPANVAVSVRAIAEIKNLSEQEVRERTSENALRVFGLAG